MRSRDFEAPVVEVVEDNEAPEPLEVLKRQFEEIKTEKENAKRRVFEAEASKGASC